ncbi:Holo-[acyl-carrier-protein] synthase [Bienertia sinuspersici]
MQETNNQEFHAAEASRSQAYGEEIHDILFFFNVPAFSTTQSVCSGPESTTTAQTKIVYEAKCNQSITAYQDESECSTIQAETSEHPK